MVRKFLKMLYSFFFPTLNESAYTILLKEIL